MATIRVTYAKLTEAGRIDGGTYTERTQDLDDDDADDVCNDPTSLDIPTDLTALGYVIIGAEVL